MTKNRKLKRMATGIKVLPETWDMIKKKIRKKHPLADQFNKLLDLKLSEVTKAYSKMLKVNSPVSTEDINREFSKETTRDFIDFAQSTKMAEIKSRNKMGNYTQDYTRTYPDRKWV